MAPPVADKMAHVMSAAPLLNFIARPPPKTSKFFEIAAAITTRAGSSLRPYLFFRTVDFRRPQCEASASLGLPSDVAGCFPMGIWREWSIGSGGRSSTLLHNGGGWLGCARRSLRDLRWKGRSRSWRLLVGDLELDAMILRQTA
jgi:hypothetical protein